MTAGSTGISAIWMGLTITDGWLQALANSLSLPLDIDQAPHMEYSFSMQCPQLYNMPLDSSACLHIILPAHTIL